MRKKTIRLTCIVFIISIAFTYYFINKEKKQRAQEAEDRWKEWIRNHPPKSQHAGVPDTITAPSSQTTATPSQKDNTLQQQQQQFMIDLATYSIIFHNP